MPPSQHHTISRRYVHSVSATLSRPHNQPALRHSVSAILSRPYNQPALRTLCQCHPLKTIQSAGVTYTLSLPPSQDHKISRRYVHSVSATLSRPHNQPALRHSVSAILSRPYNQPALRTLCHCHPLKTIQSAGVTYTLSLPPSQDHNIRRRYVHSVSAILLRPYNQPALRTLCHCHPLKTIQSAGIMHTLSVPPSQYHTISRRYIHSVSATLSRPYNQPALRTLCQYHPIKTIQSAGVTYTM